ncbi:TolC family protein [Pseudophaeobacter arcticus]|jgi:outer membrane protein TolC|uniref:TolC family protein n=1 Tax=Pseudophaeobacter arcticus TaxID=385492 RepID=UPI0024926B96|nr:TolC family protein [Pseudophaeobacter arcticus]
MKRRILPVVLAGPLALAACSTGVPEQYTNETLGFQAIADQTQNAIGTRTAFARSQTQNEALSQEVRELVLGKTISADTAVQAALLNNKGLQAAYARAGLSAAEVWQQMTPENPVVSLGLFGIGAPELGLYRALESTIAVNLLDTRTRKQRIAVAKAQFQQAQLAAVQETLMLAGETRRAWINSVAAFERLSYLRKARETADASAELASQLGKTGALNKAGQAREFAFQAELAGQVARARLEASLAKEELTRLMGLWGGDARYYVPDALPALPRSLPRVASIEAAALQNRVDLKVAQIGLEAQARAFGLTDQTRLVTDLELIAGFEAERERQDGATHTDTRPQLELEFAIPIFDQGKARMRKAELSYMQAANQLAERAVNVRSEARSAELAYHASFEIAQHYRDVVLPLRKSIEEEGLLSYNGMITNTFELLTDLRDRLSSALQAANAKRDFWLAQANVNTAIYGGGAGSAALRDPGAEIASGGSPAH